MSEGPLARTAAEVRSGALSAAALVARSLERIDASAASLNAVVATDPATAMRAAERVDRARAGALAGLPLLVKDVEDAAGLPTTACSVLWREAPPATRDAPVVAALKRAGAVVVGKAATSEFAWEGHSWSHVHGATRNPWNRELSPGGSSGGSAAALSAGLVAIATATDVGGSVRTPAAQCGLLGLKPTNGLLATDDQPGGLDQLTPGILANHPGDLRLLFELLAAAPGASVTVPARVALSRVRACPRIVGHEPLDPAVAAAFEAAMPWVERLARSVGAPLEIADQPLVGDPRGDEDPLVQFALDLRDFVGGDLLAERASELDPSLRVGIEASARVSLDDYLALRRRRLGFQRHLDAALRGTWIVTPTLAIAGLTAAGVPVSDPGGVAGAIPQSTTNTNLHNWTGHPALSVPAGAISTTAIPFGLQITGARGSDRQLLDAADRWFQIAPWPATAPGWPPLVR